MGVRIGKVEGHRLGELDRFPAGWLSDNVQNLIQIRNRNVFVHRKVARFKRHRRPLTRGKGALIYHQVDPEIRITAKLRQPLKQPNPQWVQQVFVATAIRSKINHDRIDRV